MRGVNRMALSSERTVGMQSHALATLEYIRTSIDSASSYAVPGLTGIVMGGIGLAAAGAAVFATSFEKMLIVWLGAAFVAGTCGSAIMIGKHAHGAMMLQRGSARRFVLCLTPTLVAGAVMTIVLWYHGQERLLPGSWLLLYGAAVLSASTMTARCVAAMGALFAFLGVAAFLAPPSWSNALLGLGFGALHLLFGLYLVRAAQSGTSS
jgi:hypothetical protein